MSDRRFDVAVVGNGMVGLTAAEAIKRTAPETSVVVIGPDDRQGGASQAAGAMLGCFGEITKYSLASAPAVAKLELGLAAHNMWGDFLGRLSEAGDRPVHVARGTFVVLNARSGSLDSENFEAMREALAAYDQPFQQVHDVPGLDPTPDGRPLQTLYLPDEHGVDSLEILDRTTELGRRAGVRVLDGRARNIAENGSSATVVLEDGSTLQAGHVVLAAGVFSAPLLHGLAPGAVQPIMAGAGMAYVAERQAGVGFDSVVRSINRGGSCGLHVVPLRDGHEYYGATNVVFLEPEMRPHIGVCHFLAGCAMDQLDQTCCFSRIEETRIGNRPVPLDTYPLLGPVTDNVTLVTGTYRDGFHASLQLAEMIASTVLSGQSAFPEVFDATRRPLSTMSREDSISEFTMQAVSSAYENDTRLSRFMYSGDLEEIFRPRAQAMYDTLPNDISLEPDILHFLVLNRKSDADLDPLREYLAGSTKD